MAGVPETHAHYLYAAVKISAFAILLLVGTVVCGLVLRRKLARLSPRATPAARNAAPTPSTDAWPDRIRLIPVGSFRANSGAARRLMTRLRCEEERQRPQEGRN